MLSTEIKNAYCGNCGGRLSDGVCPSRCNSQIGDALAAPSYRVRSDQLPTVVSSQLTKVQSGGLAFACKHLNVKSAMVQSFNLGSSSAGTLKFAMVGRSFGPWSVFGGMGSIHQTSVNAFRTDIQIKLKDDAGQKAFLNYSLPFAITLAIEPGESLRVYFVRGGLQEPTFPGDFRVDTWTPFVAENTETGQLIPIAGLPTLGPPKTGLIKAAGAGALITFFAAILGASSGIIIFSSLVTLGLFVGAVFRTRHYKLELSIATNKAATSPV
jgi:hypothetical protein